MYHSWHARITHGTHDTRKVGRHWPEGCIGLFDENSAKLSDLGPFGAQVRVI
jgi:hypothetical protein